MNKINKKDEGPLVEECVLVAAKESRAGLVMWTDRSCLEYATCGYSVAWKKKHECGVQTHIGLNPEAFDAEYMVIVRTLEKKNRSSPAVAMGC
jgi:hypothetical protein